MFVSTSGLGGYLMLPLIQVDGELSRDEQDYISSTLSDRFTVCFIENTNVFSDPLRRLEEKLDLLSEDIQQILLTNRGIRPRYVVGTRRA
jgi:hypothetical protein